MLGILCYDRLWLNFLVNFVVWAQGSVVIAWRKGLMHGCALAVTSTIIYNNYFIFYYLLFYLYYIYFYIFLYILDFFLIKLYLNINLIYFIFYNIYLIYVILIINRIFIYIYLYLFFFWIDIIIGMVFIWKKKM